MPEQHYRDYGAYYHEQPFGGWREDFRFAYLLAALVGMLGGENPRPSDFMPFYPSAGREGSQTFKQAMDERFAERTVVRVKENE